MDGTAVRTLLFTLGVSEDDVNDNAGDGGDSFLLSYGIGLSKLRAQFATRDDVCIFPSFRIIFSALGFLHTMPRKFRS